VCTCPLFQDAHAEVLYVFVSLDATAATDDDDDDDDND
jgi:hypothetical protein